MVVRLTPDQKVASSTLVGTIFFVEKYFSFHGKYPYTYVVTYIHIHNARTSRLRRPTLVGTTFFVGEFFSGLRPRVRLHRRGGRCCHRADVRRASSHLVVTTTPNRATYVSRVVRPLLLALAPSRDPPAPRAFDVTASPAPPFDCPSPPSSAADASATDGEYERIRMSPHAICERDVAQHGCHPRVVETRGSVAAKQPSDGVVRVSLPPRAGPSRRSSIRARRVRRARRRRRPDRPGRRRHENVGGSRFAFAGRATRGRR